MNRTFKFRAWTGNEMIYDILVGKFGTFFVNPGPKGDGLDMEDKGSLSRFNSKYTENSITTQFTGFKDRDGKEIYEGDILKIEVPVKKPDFFSIEKPETKFINIEVVWDKRGFVAFNKNYENATIFSPIYFHKTEAVGNIFENAELLLT